MITKGTKVFIRTTNGGACTVTLMADYHETYSAFVQYPDGHYFTILAGRISSISAA